MTVVITISAIRLRHRRRVRRTVTPGTSPED